MPGTSAPQRGLEEGEVPELRFANDGSFFDKCVREGDRSRPAGEAEPRSASKAEGGSEAPSSDEAPPPPPEGATAADAPPAHADAGPAAAPEEAAGTAAPPSPAAKKPPAFVLKPKKSIVQVRTRTGQVLQPGAAKRQKAEDGEGDADKPFYLRELERYRQQACDGSGDFDRPLVK